MARYESESEDTFTKFPDSDHVAKMIEEYDIKFGTASERVRRAYVEA